MDATARRRELRQSLSERRRALPAAARIQAARGVRDSLQQLPDYLTDSHVAGYWAVHGEVPLNLAIAPLESRGQQFLLPVLHGDRTLRFAPWHGGDDIAPNRHGIPEPVRRDELLAPFELDLVLVPLLGFDRAGQRLGYGGGWYDRSFAFLKPLSRPTAPLLIGIGYAFQELPEIEAQAWDVPLDFVATEHELIDCHAQAAP